MIAFQASRGWNYQTTYNNNDATITLYADPGTGSVSTLVGSTATGLVTTVATSATAMTAGAFGELGLNIDASKNYNVYSEASVGSIAVVPGNPLLVPTTLTLGQTWSPATGASASVIAVGAVPGQTACPNATSSTIGAQVEYTYPGYKDIVSYVPGCGITDLKNPTNGAEFTLTSVATYSSIGTLARHAAKATYLDTAASLLGQRRNNYPAAKLLNSLLK